MCDLMTTGWATVVVLNVLFAQSPDQAESSVTRDPPASLTPTASQDNADTERPTAVDILEALRQQRPFNEVIWPTGVVGSPAASHQELLPEGSVVVDRTGHLRRDNTMWVFVSDPAEGEPPIKLLPNTTLEVMVGTIGSNESPIRFVVSGEVTTFDNQNYLLVHLARRAVEPEDPAVKPAVAEPDEGKQAAVEVENQPDVEPTADQIVAMLKEQKPMEELMPLDAPLPSPDASSYSTNGVARTLVPEGAPLVNRPGRLLRQGQWWTFAFEADHVDHPEPPMRILPNQNLELMVQASQRGSAGLVFVVSAEATVFLGENYLLPRVATRRIEAGNFRK